MTRTNLKSFKEKAFKLAGVREAYDELAPAYKLRWQLVELRQRAGLTQEQLAERLKTKKSNISRLESVSSAISPKLSTIADYADAVGYDIKIDFVPKRKGQQVHRSQRKAQKQRGR
jgi:ribosome-binding protein aMBF1 (putative translation factor)